MYILVVYFIILSHIFYKTTTFKAMIISANNYSSISIFCNNLYLTMPYSFPNLLSSEVDTIVIYPPYSNHI